MTHYITKPERLGSLEIKGNGKKYSIGAMIKLPTVNDIFQVDRLVISNCCDVLQIRQGDVRIKDFIPYKTWGDSIKFHESSRLFIENFYLDTPLHKLHYSNRYHVDRILQAFSLSGCANVGNVTIENIIMHTSAPMDQAIILSEGADYYHDFNIGTKSLDINMVHEEWFKATNLHDSTIGGESINITTADIKKHKQQSSDIITVPRDYEAPTPIIRIGSKDQPIKETPYTSNRINISPPLLSARNSLPVHQDTRLIAKAKLLGISQDDLRSLLA